MSRFIWRFKCPILPHGPRLGVALIYSVLVGVFSTGMSAWSLAAETPPPSCWVEFKFSPSYKELVRHGAKVSPIENFDRYAVVINPQVPDYRSGFTKRDRMWYQFFATCEDSEEAISVLAGDWIKRKWAPKIDSMIVRPPTPDDLRQVKGYLERPKYWLKDCIVAIEAMDAPPDEPATYENLPVIGENLRKFLRSYSRTQQPVFAPMVWSTNYGNSRLYIQFMRSCDRRIEMARNLVAAYRQNYHDGGKYRVLKRKFDPHSLKRYSMAPVWLDHYFPKGPPKK